MSIVLALLGALRAALRTLADLALENLALRQQLALLCRGSKRPQFRRLDRLLWVWVVHFNVTDSPTAAWTTQQIVEAFPDSPRSSFGQRQVAGKARESWRIDQACQQGYC